MTAPPLTPSPLVRPLGYVLIGKDNAPVPSVRGELPALYPSLRAACYAETAYRERTGRRALPTAVYASRAFLPPEEAP